MQCAAYLALSLDGFIAGAGDDLSWLEGLGDPAEIQKEFDAFISGIDAIVMGRRTFETVITFGDWPYTPPVFVLSHGDVTVPAALAGAVERLSGAPQVIADALAARGFSSLYIDGGETVRRFLAADMLDRLVLTWAPCLLGRGIPLFGPGVPALSLCHDRTRVLGGGLVQSAYRRAAEGVQRSRTGVPL